MYMDVNINFICISMFMYCIYLQCCSCNCCSLRKLSCYWFPIYYISSDLTNISVHLWLKYNFDIRRYIPGTWDNSFRQTIITVSLLLGERASICKILLANSQSKLQAFVLHLLEHSWWANHGYRHCIPVGYSIPNILQISKFQAIPIEAVHHRTYSHSQRIT